MARTPGNTSEPGACDPAWKFGTSPEQEHKYRQRAQADAEAAWAKQRAQTDALAQQLTAEEYAAMTPTERRQARTEGRADDIRGINQ